MLFFYPSQPVKSNMSQGGLQEKQSFQYACSLIRPTVPRSQINKAVYFVQSPDEREIH
jgi:hypothetical protein